MEHLINKRVKEIELSEYVHFYNMVSQYQDVLSLTIGQPDFLTPQACKRSGKICN